MALTKVSGDLLDNNISFAGIITATTANFTDVTVSGDLTVQGTTTTLDTVVTEVDKLEVGANNTTVGVAITQSGTGDILRLYDGASQVVTVADGGNIGIGTNTSLVDILTINDTNPKISIRDSGTERAFIEVDSSDNLVINNKSISNLIFETSDSERFRIDSSGNVGIGTDNPLTKTHIDGTNGDNSTLFITASDLDADYGGTISLGGNYDGTNRTTFTQIKGLKDNNTSGQYGGYLSFLTRTNGQSAAERLRITSTGSIGVGEADPSPHGGEYRGIDVGYKGSGITGRTGNPTVTLRSNIYYDGSNWKYGEGSTSAGVLSVGGNQLIFEAAASGTAGATATISEKFRIDSNGYLTVTNQPSFRAGRNSNYSPGANTDIVFNVTNASYQHNNGGHYDTSNGRFTAPVAGMYTFSAHVIWQSLNNGQDMTDAFNFLVNGSQAGYSFRRGVYVSGTTGTNGYYTDFGSYDVYLEANEYVTVRNARNLTVHGNQYYTTFSGCLIS